MNLACIIARFAAACGRSPRHLDACPACRTRHHDQRRLDADLRQLQVPAPPGRAPASVIAAVRAAATPELPPQSARRGLSIAATACAVAVIAAGLALLPDQSPAPPITTARPVPEALSLPGIATATPPAATTLDLPMTAAYQSEFELLVADFRRGTGAQ